MIAGTIFHHYVIQLTNNTIYNVKSIVLYINIILFEFFILYCILLFVIEFFFYFILYFVVIQNYFF